MDPIDLFRSLGNRELLERAESLASSGRATLSELLACLGEIDRRKLYAEAGFHSMFAYCLARLRCSEAEAYRRIHAARAVARHPEILSFLRDGTLSLTAVSMLAPHQRREDFLSLLSRAQGLSQNKLELLISEIAPERTRRDCIRYLGHPPLPVLPPKDELFAGLQESISKADPPETTGLEDAPPPAGGEAPLPAGAGCRASGMDPLPPENAPVARAGHQLPGPSSPPLVRFSFTADESLLTWVERARDLLRHKYPYAKLEDIFREALDEFLDHRDPGRKLARKRARENNRAETTPQPREPADDDAPLSPGGDSATKEKDQPAGKSSPVDEDPPFGRALDRSRRIPQRVRDEVWERDRGRCAFVSPDGHRCGTSGMLEFDHIIPWAQGGPSDDPDNIRLLCRTHNQWAARAAFGTDA